MRWLRFTVGLVFLLTSWAVAPHAANQPNLNRAPWYKPPQLFVMTGFIANTTDGVWGTDNIVNGVWTPEKQQVALRAWQENLGEDFDADRMVREFQDAGATGVIFYDKWHDGVVNHATRLTAFRNHRDFVKATLAALRRHKMAAVVYYSVGLDHNPQLRNWTCLDAQGKPMGRAFPGDWKSFYSPYRQYVLNQLAETLKDDGPISGFWMDLYTQPNPMSYDPYTLKAFQGRYGIPARHATAAQLEQFHLATLRDFLLEIRQKLQKIQPGLSFTFNGAGMDDDAQPAKAHLVDSLTDWFSVEGHVWPNIDRDSRVLHAADRPFEVGMLVNSSWYVPMSNDAPPPPMSEDQAVVSAATAWINGANVYAAMTPGHSGVFNPQGDLRLLRAMGDWLKRNRAELVGARPYAEIGILSGDPASDVVKVPDLGELWKASHNFKVIETDHEPGFDTGRELRHLGYLTERVGGIFASRKFDLSSYRMLVLPENSLLDGEAIRNIREYVRKGGTLLSFGYSSLFDQEGHLRSNFALADVFGVDFAGTLPGYKQLSYAPGSDLASYLYLNPGALAVKSTAGRALARWKYAGGSPAIVENTFGSGRSIYLSVEEPALSEGSALLKELAERLAGPPAFRIKGHRHYALMVNRQGNDLLCYVLNRDTAPPPYTEGRPTQAFRTPPAATPERVRLSINTSIPGKIKSAELIPSSNRLFMSRHGNSVELYFNASPSVTTVRLTLP